MANAKRKRSRAKEKVHKALRENNKRDEFESGISTRIKKQNTHTHAAELE